MTKHIELKTVNQGTGLATGTLAFPPLVIEGLEEFKGSFDRLCLQAGTSAIEAMLAAQPGPSAHASRRIEGESPQIEVQGQPYHAPGQPERGCQ
jgi:hypothetical protein